MQNRQRRQRSGKETSKHNESTDISTAPVVTGLQVTQAFSLPGIHSCVWCASSPYWMGLTCINSGLLAGSNCVPLLRLHHGRHLGSHLTLLLLCLSGIQPLCLEDTEDCGKLPMRRNWGLLPTTSTWQKQPLRPWWSFQVKCSSSEHTDWQETPAGTGQLSHS